MGKSTGTGTPLGWLIVAGTLRLTPPIRTRGLTSGDGRPDDGWRVDRTFQKASGLPDGGGSLHRESAVAGAAAETQL